MSKTKTITRSKKAGIVNEKSRLIVKAVGKLRSVLQKVITSCAPEQRATLETGGRDGIKQVVANLKATSTSRHLNKIENIIVQVSQMRDAPLWGVIEHVS